MQHLIETRQRYSQMLEALGETNPLDQHLRTELETTIDAIDEKIACMADAPEFERVCRK